MKKTYTLEKNKDEIYQEFPKLKNTHEDLRVLFKKMNDILKANNIRFSLLAGSIIGAVKSKEILPWDDDIDIVIWHEDYDLAIDLLKEKNIEIQLDKQIPSANYKLASIDIVQYNYLPKKYSKKLNLLLWFAMVINFRKAKPLRKQKNFKTTIKFLIYYIIRTLTFLIPIKNGFLQQKIRMKSRKFKSTKMGITTVYWDYKKGFWQSKNFELINMEFEGMETLVIKDYDEFLKTKYQNWEQQLKPEECIPWH